MNDNRNEICDKTSLFAGEKRHDFVFFVEWRMILMSLGVFSCCEEGKGGYVL